MNSHERRLRLNQSHNSRLPRENDAHVVFVSSYSQRVPFEDVIFDDEPHGHRGCRQKYPYPTVHHDCVTNAGAQKHAPKDHASHTHGGFNAHASQLPHRICPIGRFRFPEQPQITHQALKKQHSGYP